VLQKFDSLVEVKDVHLLFLASLLRSSVGLATLRQVLAESILQGEVLDKLGDLTLEQELVKLFYLQRCLN